MTRANQIGTAILAATIALTLLLAWTATAEAHTPGRVECRTYQQMHHLITGSQRLAAQGGRQCRIAAAAHTNTHPLPDHQIPPVMRRVRACESGKRTASGKAIDGTFYYRADNPGPSTASGGYGYLDTTWAGHLGWARALDAPPRVQDRRAIRDSQGGTYLTPWEASRGCWS